MKLLQRVGCVVSVIPRGCVTPTHGIILAVVSCMLQRAAFTPRLAERAWPAATTRTGQPPTLRETQQPTPHAGQPCR